MKSLEQIAHGAECRFNRAVQVGSGGGLFDDAIRTGQERRIRGVHLMEQQKV
jgi:hypothetical protein